MTISDGKLEGGMGRNIFHWFTKQRPLSSTGSDESGFEEEVAEDTDYVFVQRSQNAVSTSNAAPQTVYDDKRKEEFRAQEQGKHPLAVLSAMDHVCTKSPWNSDAKKDLKSSGPVLHAMSELTVKDPNKRRDFETLRSNHNALQERQQLVAREMRSQMGAYVNQQALVEEEIMRRQEQLARSKANNSGTSERTGENEMNEGSTSISLIKQKVLADLDQECVLVAQNLAEGGINCSMDTIARALKPIPDRPKEFCMQHLPKPVLDDLKENAKKGKSGTSGRSKGSTKGEDGKKKKKEGKGKGKGNGSGKAKKKK